MATIDDFNNCIDRCGLLESSSEGMQFTWCNGQDGNAKSWARLDRTLVNFIATRLLANLGVRLLAKETSDHYPMLIYFKQSNFHMDELNFVSSGCGVSM